MKKRQKFALVLAMVMGIQCIPTTLLANPQAQVQDVWYSKDIEHNIDPVTGEMTPNVSILFKDPGVIAGNNAGSPNDYEEDDQHRTLFYQVELDKNNQGKPFRSEPISAVGNTIETSLTQGMKYGFDAYGEQTGTTYAVENGSLYKMRIIATHFHYTTDSQGKEIRNPAPADIIGPKEVYFLTDFDTRVEVVEEGLKVSWEYIPDMSYMLHHVEGIKETVNEVENSGMAEFREITAEEAKKLEVNGRVEYTLKGLKSQRAYSMYVAPTGYNRDGVIFADIERNEATGKSGPKIVSAITPITITVTPINNGMIEIYWGDITGIINENPLECIQVLAKSAGSDNYTVVAQTNDSLSSQKSIIIEEPKVDTTYKILFKFQNNYPDKESNSCDYEIKKETIPPYTPRIPEPFGPHVDLEASDKNPKKYLVTGDDRIWYDEEGKVIEAYLKDYTEQTFHGLTGTKAAFQIVWDAPLKQDDSGEVDYDLVYDIWVSDDRKVLEEDSANVPKVVEDRKVSESDTTKLIKHHKEDTVLGMKWELDTYYNTDTKQIEMLKRNKTYYVRIVAKRAISGAEGYAVSKPTLVAITMDKNGHIYAPSVIGKPPLQLQAESVTSHSMVIEWRTKWWEVAAKNLAEYGDYELAERILAEIGSSRVYTPNTYIPEVSVGPSIRYAYKKDYLEHNLENGDDAEAVKVAVNAYENSKNDTSGVNYFDAGYYLKEMLLADDIEYELSVLSYEAFEKMLETSGKETIEEWMYAIASDDTLSGLKWDAITPESAQGKTDWLQHEITATTQGEALKPNTRYIMMIRTYRIVDGEKLQQYFPSYVIGTTLTDFVGPEAIPTVPNLYVNKDSITDTSFEVYWKYNEDFEYDIVYATGEDPQKAEKLDFTIVSDPSLENRDENKYYFINGQNAYVKLTGLFPETTYNVWIRAKQKVGSLVSDFSTPATAKTLSLDAPDVPRGLGPASKESLYEVGDDKGVSGEDFVTVEWTKDTNDKGTQSLEGITKRYEYDLEFADNVEFIDSVVVTVTDALGGEANADFLAKTLTRFGELLPNRPYYIRVRARIIMTDAKQGKEIMKESEYSKWIRMMTKKTDNEYDGGENDNIVTYPNKVEESFNSGVWEWEIKDVQGVISDIIESEQYVYEIEMDLYKNRYDAVVRRIVMPAPVMQALIGQRMELRVTTHRAEYRIPARALSYKLEQSRTQDTLVFEFETKLAYDLEAIAKPYPYVVENAEAMQLYMRSTTSNNARITYFDDPIDVAIRLDEPYAYQENTYRMYTYDDKKGDWVEGSHEVQVREDDTYLSYRNQGTGIYALYKVDTYYAYDAVNYAMQALLSQYNIMGLGTSYQQDDTVGSNAFINLMLGLAEGQRDINLESYISTGRRSQANLTRLYMGNRTYITQEEALNGVIRLCEMKTGYRIQPAQKTFAGVNPEYSQSVAKAYTLGIITDIDPDAVVSYGELSTWIQMILPQ